MVHLFHALDKSMALDVGSGSIHALDEIAFDALSFLMNEPSINITDKLQDKYPRNEVEDTLRELHEAIAMGSLCASDDYSDVNMAGTGIVKAICLHAAHDCNLRCQYCFADTGEYHMRDRSLLSVDTGKKALDWLVVKSGTRKNLEVDFFGGEPLMNFSVIKEVVGYGRKLEQSHNKVFRFTVTTNAIALTTEMMDFLNKEMDNVVISLDGRKEVHDRMRPATNGRGSYDIVMRKAKQFVKKRGQQRYFLRGTFTNYNMDFTEDVEHLADEGFKQISIEPVVAAEDACYAIRETDLPRVFAEYERLGKLYVKRRANGQWFNFFHFSLDLENGPCLKKRLTGCGAGNEYVAITANGDIYPCHQFVGRDGMRMGSIWDNSFDVSIQHRFQQNHVINKEKCAACWARFYCSGGCSANAHAFNGDIGMPYDMECQMERKRLECALAIYAMEHTHDILVKDNG